MTLSGYGPHSVTAADMDAAGNVGTSTADSITYAHPVTITSSGSLTNQVHQTITGTGEAGMMVTVFDGATALGSTTVAGNGTWSDAVTLSNAQGTHSITASEMASGGTPTLSTLVSLNTGTGDLPWAGMTIDSHGNLYGLTTNGGSAGHGTLFEVDATTHAITTLINFDGGLIGGAPVSTPMVDANGNVFGTAQIGGAFGHGSIWEYNAQTHTATTIASLDGATTGNQPYGGLIADANGNLYGTAVNGGAHGAGTVFEVDATSHAVTTLVSFSGTDGSSPWASLTFGPDGNLYGTTQSGGTGWPGGFGTVFELNPTTQALTTLVNFNGANGSDAPAALTLGSDGNFYGTTFIGGAHGYGTLFELNPTTHQLTTLASFDSANTGAAPDATVYRDASGNLFGTAMSGGAFGQGTIFEYNAQTQALTTLVNFNLANGGSPLSTLIADVNGNLYGTTQQGGSFSAGTVFELSGLSHSLSTSTPVTYTVDTGAPIVVGTGETSTNASPTLAKAGETITETFTVDPALAGVAVTVDSVTIDGQSATVVHGAGDQYTATYTVLAGDTNGPAGVVVTAHDAAGNSIADTLTGLVTVDTVAPVVHLTSEVSNNATTSLAKVGDVITETFTSTDMVTGVTIDGNAATVNHIAGNNYTATYTVQVGDINGAAGVQVTSHDAAGNVTTVSDGGSVVVDTVAPFVVDGGELSSNHTATLAKPGDVITETFSSTDTVDGVTIDGQTAAVQSLGGGDYTATYTVLAGDPSGAAPVVITAHDAAGNVTVDMNPGAVTVASTIPTASGFGQASLNVHDMHMATAGDMIVGEFTVASATPSVGVTIDSVTIDGQAVTPHVLEAFSLGPNVYDFGYVTKVTDPGGLANVVVSMHDDAGNTNVVTFGGSVTIDTLPPTITRSSSIMRAASRLATARAFTSMKPEAA